MNIRSELFKYKEDKYKEFSSKSNPTVNPDTIIGVRVPNIRSIVKNLSIEDKINFINDLPHNYFEENIVHTFIMTNFHNNFDDFLIDLNKFLPYIDSWVITDTMSPKILKKYPIEGLKLVKDLLKSKYDFGKRLGVVFLMQYYMDNNFSEDHLYLLSSINSDNYYVNMSIAWYYSVALIKHYDETIKIFENKVLTKWIHNKSIQKAIESYRISDEKKAILKKLKN